MEISGFDKAFLFQYNEEPLVFMNGSMDTFRKYISDNMSRYNSDEYSETEYRIIVSYTINDIGEIEKVNIVNGDKYNLEKTVKNLFNSIPLWRRGFYNGEPIENNCTMPIIRKY